MFDAKLARLPRAIVAIGVLIVVLVTVVLSGCIGPRGWPGVATDGDMLYLGTIGVTEGRIIALNPEGGVKWEWRPTKEESPASILSCGCPQQGSFGAGMIYGTPAVANSTVYAGLYTGRVYGIDAGNGFERWHYDVGSPVVGGPAIGNGTVYVGTSDGWLYALDANVTTVEGKLKQGFERVRAGDKIWSRPVYKDGVVYFGSLDHKLYAVDADSGKPTWDEPFRTLGAIASPALVVDGAVYVGSFDGRFYSIDAATGKQKWVFDQARNWYWSDAVYDRGVIYACSLDHKVYAINAESGNLTSAWPGPFDVGAPIKASPVIVNNVLVVASEEGAVYGIDVDTGNEKWPRIDLGAKVLAPLCALGNKVYVNAEDNKLHRIDVDAGRRDLSISLGK